jgi:hypothetical protein
MVRQAASRRAERSFRRIDTLFERLGRPDVVAIEANLLRSVERWGRAARRALGASLSRAYKDARKFGGRFAVGSPSNQSPGVVPGDGPSISVSPDFFDQGEVLALTFRRLRMIFEH